MNFRIKNIITLALLVCCCAQAAPLIQKLKKVSKPNDGQEWMVTIYEVEKNGGLGKRIARSKFKKDTDGLLTNKLRFDFTNTTKNKIVYGPKNKLCQVIISQFDHQPVLEAELRDDCTIKFTPEVKLSENSVKTKKVEVNLPDTVSEPWTIASGNQRLKRINTDADQYVLDRIQATGKSKKTELMIYAELPSLIGVQKSNQNDYTITVLKQKELDMITQKGIIEIDENGNAHAEKKVKRKSSATALNPAQSPLIIHGLNPDTM